MRSNTCAWMVRETNMAAYAKISDVTVPIKKAVMVSDMYVAR